MFQGENFSRFSTRNMVIWFALAFQAGTINAGGLLATHRFVTHTTGFATLFGTDLAQGAGAAAFGMLSVPLFFVLGTMFSAFFVDRKLIRREPPHYSLVMGTITILLVAIVVLGNLRVFGSFGEPFLLTRDYALLALLCLISGIQNAVVSSASGAVVRTTHLTGLTTDLGIGLVRVLFHESPQNRDADIRATWMRIGLIGSFILGSATSASIYLRQQYWGFGIPAVISALLWVSIIRRRRELRRAFIERNIERDKVPT